MPFPYYARLTARQKQIYRASAAIVAVELPGAGTLLPLVGELERALAAEDRRAVQDVAGRLADGPELRAPRTWRPASARRSS